MEENLKPVVRGVDVGYGHVKWAGDPARGGKIEAGSFPSKAPVSVDNDLNSDFLMRRDSFTVPVGGRMYEVGKQVDMAIGNNQELDQLDHNFCLSDGYAARLYGALNYIYPGLGSLKKIDVLVLGLPINTIGAHCAALEKKFCGEHIINARGDKVHIAMCKVHAQPLGSYALYIEQHPEFHKEPPRALVIDPGYNSVDWFSVHGLVTNPSQSKAVNRGVSAVLRAIAKSILKAHAQYGATESEIVTLLDRHFTGVEKFHIAGNDIDLEPHIKAGEHVIEQAAQAIRDHIGAGTNIRLILLTGGGAALYADKIREKLPSHKVEMMGDSALANARGFSVIGKWIAPSARRAVAQAKGAAK